MCSRGAAIDAIGYGEPRELEGVRVSLHPAGHLLGSAQVRVEHRGETWVVSGDYKTRTDPTCAAFEPVPCDVFISECTFGLPIYRWRDDRAIFDEVDTWWRGNIERQRTSVLFAYALGKAQRVLAGVDASIGPILVHGAVDRFMPVYRAAGIELPPTRHADATSARETRGRALVVAPPSAAGSTWIRKFGPVSTAFASGWMQIRGPRRRRGFDRGFAISDHVDWPGLLDAIDATGASRIGLTHGYTAPVARWLDERGRDAFVVPTRFEGEDAGDDSGEPPGDDGDAPCDD